MLFRIVCATAPNYLQPRETWGKSHSARSRPVVIMTVYSLPTIFSLLIDHNFSSRLHCYYIGLIWALIKRTVFSSYILPVRSSWSIEPELFGAIQGRRNFWLLYLFPQPEHVVDRLPYYLSLIWKRPSVWSLNTKSSFVWCSLGEEMRFSYTMVIDRQRKRLPIY